MRAGALAANGDVYVGGDFTFLGAGATRYVAHWSGAAWNELGNGAMPATATKRASGKVTR